MRLGDIPGVMSIADSLPEAPRWPESAYVRALDPEVQPARICLVADDPGADVAGFLITVLIPPQAELETIAVARRAQRRGWGAGLLANLLVRLKDLHITEVMLEVRESNDSARRFYAAAGFRETGCRPGYYSDPKEDAVLLARRVP